MSQQRLPLIALALLPGCFVGLALAWGAMTGPEKDPAASFSPPNSSDPVRPDIWEDAGPRGVAPPPGQHVVRRGEVLYAKNCYPCHGPEGRGDGPAASILRTWPRDLARGIFKFGTTSGFPADEDLFRSITTGFSAYGMPSFRALPEADRWALVDHVKRLVSEGQAAQLIRAAAEEGERISDASIHELVTDRMRVGARIEIPDEPVWQTEEAVRTGRELFAAQCTKCHGDTGRGDGESVDTLLDSWGDPIAPRDLTIGPMNRKAGWRARDTVRVLLRGIPGTPMPVAPADPATEDGRRELWALARYVESLSR